MILLVAGHSEVCHVLFNDFDHFIVVLFEILSIVNFFVFLMAKSVQKDILLFKSSCLNGALVMTVLTCVIYSTISQIGKKV